VALKEVIQSLRISQKCLFVPLCSSFWSPGDQNQNFHSRAVSPSLIINRLRAVFVLKMTQAPHEEGLFLLQVTNILLVTSYLSPNHFVIEIQFLGDIAFEFLIP